MMLTNVADTSIDAFHEHRDSGKLGRQQQRLLDYMARVPLYPFTRSELANRTGMPLSAVCGRVFELVTLGKLVELPRRLCSITGKSAHPVSLSKES